MANYDTLKLITGHLRPSSFPFILETNFYRQTEALREQLEHSFQKSAADDQALLTYEYLPDECCYISASIDRVFSQEIVFDFVDRLRGWAGEQLGASRVSTPQLRIYINGCFREMMRDAINAKWHYLFSLTKNKANKLPRIKIIADATSDLNPGVSVSIGSVRSTKLDLGDVLVHDMSRSYGIDRTPPFMNPADGAVFLEGYLW